MKLTVRLIALLMGILMLSGCGPSTIGEKQSFNPNLTVGGISGANPREYTAEGRHSQASL